MTRLRLLTALVLAGLLVPPPLLAQEEAPIPKDPPADRVPQAAPAEPEAPEAEEDAEEPAAEGADPEVPAAEPAEAEPADAEPVEAEPSEEPEAAAPAEEEPASEEPAGVDALAPTSEPDGGEPAREAETAMVFDARVLATGLQAPWEVVLGPDNFLWVTERTGKRVTRIDPATGAARVVLTVEDAFAGPQHEGVLGLALDPRFGQGSDFVYLAYTYNAGDGSPAVENRRTRIVRYAWDGIGQFLGAPRTLISEIPAGDDHNAGRLLFGPDGMLYFSNGEQGANQFQNVCRPNEAQRLPTAEELEDENWAAYRGKVLRLTPEGGIPGDNPELAGVRSHVFTYGHRNPQGLVFTPDGLLFSAEQGPSSDDEINLLEAGGNYGWPHVAGFRDDQAYSYRNWSAAQDCTPETAGGATLLPGVTAEAETAWSDPAYKDPQKTLYTVPTGYPFADAACGEAAYICNPTIAPASIDYYPRDGAVVAWRNSLLLPSLKNGALYRLGLTDDGRWVQGDVEKLFPSVNRYRDLALSPDGGTVFIATDSAGLVRDPAGGATEALTLPGAILAFTQKPLEPLPAPAAP